MEIKKIRKTGLWVIIGATLIALLGINVSDNFQFLNPVLTVAIIVLIVWLIAMAVAGMICHRH